MNSLHYCYLNRLRQTVSPLIEQKFNNRIPATRRAVNAARGLKITKPTPSVAPADDVVYPPGAVEIVMNSALERLEATQRDIVEGRGKVHPGQPLRFTEASTVNDMIAQGDVNFIVVEGIPEGYVLAEKPSTQIAKGTTKGSRHEIRRLDTVDVYLPPTWNDAESLQGPLLVAKSETKVKHPQHGEVTIPAGMHCRIEYQQNLDAVTRRAQRARD